MASNGPLSSHSLKELAQGCGFDLCGFARPEPIPPAVLTEWLEAGFHADMDWMEARAAERLDIRRLMPEVQTVVALANNYYLPDPGGSPSPVARYARGRDYHSIIRRQLRKLRGRVLELRPEAQTYSSVDTGPFMEKIWAARAGLGYVGRNGCLITEEFGSYVVLSVLAMDLPVDRYADAIPMDRCGDCSLCITSCPTEALIGAGRLDARRCISYQTIENRGDIPPEVRPALGDLVFGCDVCQDVCPLNYKPMEAGLAFRPRATASMSVREIAALTPEEYATVIPGTPLARAKYDGLRKNAAYALGAAKDRGALEILERLRADRSHPVRTAAAWALDQIRGN